MKNTHIIQRQVFKIEIDGQDNFKEVCQIIERLFKNELGSHIENVLDAYNLNDEDFIIDRLDIDLGNLDISNLQESIKSSFIRSFERKLEEKLKYFPGQVKIVDRETRNKTVFDFFIKNGNSPWWVSTKKGNLKKEFTRFFYTRNYQTRSIWQQALKNPVQLKRLLYNLDLELLISYWTSTTRTNFKIPKQELVKAILGVVEKQGLIVGRAEVINQVKLKIVTALFEAKNFKIHKEGNTERIRQLFDDMPVDRFLVEKMIRIAINPQSKNRPDLPQLKNQTTVSREDSDIYVERNIGTEFVHFLKYGYPYERNEKGAFSSITKIFEHLLNADLAQLSSILRHYAKSNRIRQRFLDQVSQDSISAFFRKIAPDKKELFDWIEDLYVTSEESLKPINQTNIRVQKSVNEVTLEIFIQQNLNNLSSESFLRLHFKKMALRYNIRYSDLLRIVAKIINSRKVKRPNENKYVGIIEKLYSDLSIRKNIEEEELEEDEDWEMVIKQDKREIPEVLLNQIPREVIKELMHVKNSGILGKSTITIQQLISAYIRFSDKGKSLKVDDPKLLIKNIAEFLEVDKGFLEFALIYSAKMQTESNLFLPQEHLLFEQLSKSSVANAIKSQDDLGIIVKHFIKYKNLYDISHLKKIFTKKILFEKIDKKTFRQFMQLIFADQHKKIADFILGIAIVDDADARKKIEKQVYGTFVHETLMAGIGDFNVSKVFSKIRILLQNHITDSIEIPKSILGITSSYIDKSRKGKSGRKSVKMAYIKEKNLLTLYHILDLDLVLENVGNSFFDNIIFSFDLLLTKHRPEFIEVLFQNRFNRELAYYLTYQDEAGLLQQIEKIFSANKVEVVHRAIESASNLLGKLNWVRMGRSELKQYITLFTYPALFSKKNERINFHDFIYTVIETAEKERLLSNDFYMLFEQKTELEIQRKIKEILEKDSLPSDLVDDSDDPVSAIRIGEFNTLASKNSDDPNNSYYFELLSSILENLRFPEGHAFYGQPWNENRDYIRRILKTAPVVLEKLQKKRLSESKLDILLQWLDIELLQLAISNIYTTPIKQVGSILSTWLKSLKPISIIDEKDFLTKLIKKSKSTRLQSSDLNKAIVSIILQEKYITSWDMMEILYDPKDSQKIIQAHIRPDEIFKNVQVDSTTWTDAYFKILSSKNFGNPKAYKLINAWIRFLFSPAMHKTQKQAFVFIFSVYFKFSFWKIKDPIVLHEILISELGLLKNKEPKTLSNLVSAMLNAGIPEKSILDSVSKDSSIDKDIFTKLFSSLTTQGISTSEITPPKDISNGILTPEQFSNTLLFEDTRNEKAAKLFQHWIGEKKWTDAEISKLFKLLSLPVLLRELNLMAKGVDLPKIFSQWTGILDQLNLYADKNKRVQALISIVLQHGIWKYKSEELVHVNLLMWLAILNNKKKADIIGALIILTEAKIPLRNIPRLKGLGLSSEGDEIKFIVEQYLLSQSDPRLLDQSNEAINGPFAKDENDLEKDILFFMQSGNLQILDDQMNENEKSVVSTIKERGISSFLEYEDLHPDSLDKILTIFSRDEAKEYVLSGISSLVKDQSLRALFDEAFNDFFEQADNESILKIMKQFNDVAKMRTLSAESRLDLLMREISKVRQMERSISKSLDIHKKEDLKNVKVLKKIISESSEKKEAVVTDVEKIFLYFLEYGLIMPDAHIITLQELRSILLKHMKANPNAVRYILHIKTHNQKSRKRIVQMMRTGMSVEILSIIHPELKKELNAFEMLMKNNFNINIWEVLGIDNESARWDHILLLWSGINSKTKDPIEILELLLKSVLKKLDDTIVHQLQIFDARRFSISERSIWKGLVALIPELKYISPDQKRKLKSPEEVKNTAEQAAREEEILDPEEGITVYNAGLVLLWPFLSRYFSMLELSNAKDFLGDEERARAIQLTQYLVTGQKEMEEWNLSLNKILCGAELNFPVEPTFDISLEEEELSEKMLKGALQNWPKLKNSKPDTFRETFLRREGRLYKRDNRWELFVEKKSYDMLLDSLPWNISMIKLNWMPDRLVVVWN